MAVSFVQVGLLRLSKPISCSRRQPRHDGHGVACRPHHQQALHRRPGPAHAGLRPAPAVCPTPPDALCGKAVIGFALMFVGLGLLKDGRAPHHGGGLGGSSGNSPDGGIGRRPRHRRHRHGGHRGPSEFIGHDGPHHHPRRRRRGLRVGRRGMLLGANIGTTSTVILASWWRAREARRAALSHAPVNFFGVCSPCPSCIPPRRHCVVPRPDG